jgi:DNA-binding NarL/FixJ family response regulator
VLVEYDRAGRWLTEGIRYAQHVESWNHRHYMASHLAHVQWCTGRWTAAAQSAEQARLAAPRAAHAAWHPLTDRELEIAQLIADGLTNKQIAAQLVLAPKTISAHVAHILAKLGAARRAKIAAWCSAVQIKTRRS